MRAPSPAVRKTVSKAALPIGILLSALLVYQSSYAAFTATTTNPGNSWSTGTVVLTDSGSGTAVFNSVNMVPGTAVERCITVSYSGSLNANVRLYTTSVTPTDGTSLAPHLTFKVQELLGTCVSRGVLQATSVPTVLRNGTDGFADVHTDATDGFGPWAATGGSTTTRAYVFTTNVPDTAAAQGKTVSATLTWHATSSS